MTQAPRQDVTAAIVNYGSRQDTLALVGEMAPQVHQVIVVDNSGELDPADPALADASLLQPEHNIGFGAAVNRAAAATESRWVLILNPDVRLQDKCLEAMLDASRELHAPLCGPRFYWDEACTLQLPPAMGHPLWLLSDRHFPHRNPVDMPDLSTLAVIRHERFWGEDSPFSEPVLSGACLLVDNHWFRQNRLPIFDEAFFLYYEDTDLCGRLMRKGVMPICVAGADAVHYWNQSPEPPQSKAALMQASERLFLDRYYPNGAAALPPTSVPEDIVDLGSLAQSPTVALPAGTAYVDIGVQADFILFARCHRPGAAYTVAPTMWQRLRDGDYFLRACDKGGRFLGHWRWHKHTRQDGD